jgi:DNA ligase (NAD+)
MAWKFPAEQREASALGVTWQVGRTGQLTPVLHIEPTHIDGSTISNTSLASRARFQELALSKGDKVLIEKGGDIIPQVVRVTWRPLRNPEFEVPTVCPDCNSEVRHEGAHVFCSGKECPSQLSRRILHWLNMMDVKGTGPSIINCLCSKGIVRKLSDLYYLNESEVANAIGSEKITNSIIDEIMLKSEIPLWKFLAGLGIHSLGKTASKTITKKYSNIPDIINAGIRELAGLDGIGISTATSIFTGLEEMSQDIEELERVLSIEAPATGGHLSGLSFCLTGAMSRNRKLIATDIENAGGDVKGSVSNGLDYLVIADANSTSSKAQKARKLGTKVIGEDELMGMINNA